jgi:TPR repeat protein
MPRGNRHWTRDWRLGGLVLLGLVVTAVVVLELWESPSNWLRGPRSMVVDGLHWLRAHWLTSGALGVIATLGVFELQRRAEHRRDQREELRRKEEAQNEELRREEEARNEKAQQAQAAIDKRRKLLAANCWVDEATGWLPQVSDVQDPVKLGVHPTTVELGVHPTTAAEDLDVPPETSAETAALELPARVPVYVPRDLDATLDKALRAALARGGLVLVRGDSTAGKSRIAFEAMRRLLADLWLLVPYHRDSLRKLLAGGVKFRDVVVWLNDLEFHLGASGLDVGLLRRLVGDGDRRVVVLATMRASEYNKRSPEHERDQTGPERDVLRAERELLDQAEDFELPRQFSAAERQRADERRWDPRIAVALDHTDRYGLAEYIAAGPRLRRRWRNARDPGSPAHEQAGAAMVAAALDCRRAGLSRPVSEELLHELYRDQAYLDSRVAGRLDPAAFEQGLAWATDVVQGASALLTREPDADGYEVFDYLLDTVQTDPDARPVPSLIWEHLLSRLQADDALAVGLAAYQADEDGVAERAWQLAADAGHHDAQYNLGILLHQSGDLEEAEEWYRSAADAGHHDAQYSLGALLKDQGRLEEAEEWYRGAADAGHHDAEYNLGILLKDQGRLEEAEQWYRKAADAGHHDAETSLGILLRQRGHLQEAEHRQRRAADAH